MRRIGKLLVVLVLTPAPAASQVDVALFERQDGRDLSSAIEALEKSRDALLQAREAVDTALIEVDHALAAVRAAAPRHADVAAAKSPAHVKAARLALTPPESSKPLFGAAAQVIAPAGGAIALADGVRSAIVKRLGGWAPVLRAAGDFAQRFSQDRETLGISVLPSPAVREANGGAASSRAVLAVARDADVTAASSLRLMRSAPAQEILTPVPVAVAGPPLEPPPRGVPDAPTERSVDEPCIAVPSSPRDHALPEPRGPILPGVEGAVPTLAPGDPSI